MINKTKQLIGMALACNINLILATPTGEQIARINLATNKADAIGREINEIVSKLDCCPKIPNTIDLLHKSLFI